MNLIFFIFDWFNECNTMMKEYLFLLVLLMLNLNLSSQEAQNLTDSIANETANDTIVNNEVILKDSSVSLINNNLLTLFDELKKRNDSLRMEASNERANLLKQINELKVINQKIQNEFRLKELHLGLKDSIEKVKTIQLLDSLRQNTKGFPVAPFGDTLFNIYVKNGAASAEERAILSTERIKKAEKEIDIKMDSISIIDNIQTIDIIFKNEILVSITDNDALFLNLTKSELAEEYFLLVNESVHDYYLKTNLRNILINVGLALLVVIVQVLLVFLVIWLFKKVDNRITLLRGDKLKGLKIKSYKLLDAKNQLKFILFITRIIRYIVIAIMLFITIPVIFSIFPLTKNIAYQLFGYILDPLKVFYTSVVSYIPNLITIIVIYLITKYTVKGIAFLAKEIKIGKFKIQGFYPDWARPTFNIIRFLLYAFMFIVIFPYLPGSDSAIFKGVSVFIGVVFSLGSSSAIGNMVAGLVITYMRPYKLGDRIRVGEISGDVVEKSAFVTKLRTIKNEEITIPNSTILTSSTINFSTSAKDHGLILHTTVTIGYDVPWVEVHEALIKAAKATKMILKDPEPFVLQISLDDFYVSYQLNAYTQKPDKQALIYSNLHQNIQDKFNKAGIEIMSPHYRANRDGNYSTMPKDFLSDDYIAPSFNVKMNTENKEE